MTRLTRKQRGAERCRVVAATRQLERAGKADLAKALAPGVRRDRFEVARAALGDAPTEHDQRHVEQVERAADRRAEGRGGVAETTVRLTVWLTVWLINRRSRGVAVHAAAPAAVAGPAIARDRDVSDLAGQAMRAPPQLAIEHQRAADASPDGDEQECRAAAQRVLVQRGDVDVV